MAEYKNYYEAREKVVEVMSADLLGPVKCDEILCDEWPLDYYILGKLYPQGFGVNETSKSSSEDCGELDDEVGVSLSNSRNPSSFGLSISLNKCAKHIFLNPEAAIYSMIDKEKAFTELGKLSESYREKVRFWKRSALDLEKIAIDISKLEKEKSYTIDIADNLVIKVLLHKIYPDDSKTITITMINYAKANNDYEYNNAHAFFQPVISVTSDADNAFGDVRRNVHFSTDEELSELELLYSNKGSYASGHGCAVGWDNNQAGFPIRIYTDFFPHYEVLQMMPSASFNDKVLEMKHLAEGKKGDIIAGLDRLVCDYSEWISTLEMRKAELGENHLKAANKNIDKCKETLSTLHKSIVALDEDMIFKAFQLSNRAMFIQRKRMLVRTQKFTDDECIRWYPFQLAFFLQEIISYADPNGEERKKVDLLWFPTGGGKTEAYLGIAAFVIFLRRLRHKENGAGVTILMRYTLRLLTFQQFERASALICACDYIRRVEHIKGGEIGIGLWAGKDLTPNRIKDANDYLIGTHDEDDVKSNPAQVKKCPWCGKDITANDYSCNLVTKRMTIKCSNPECEFHSGLPIYLVDEDIYAHAPTFIVATVDKFAQVALNSDTSSMFGITNGNYPPELVIQDELHLISGPLGTICGVYEAAFRKLCENDGHFPKIVASTATIRNAKEQIKSLYSSGYTQFPPQGLTISDSFFAQESTPEERPSRVYLGCMGIGTSPTTMMIRTMASMLYATRYLVALGYDDKIIDSFWTITGYFNTLRELGGAIVRVVDDIQDRFNYLKTSKFVNVYPIKSMRLRYDKYKELTSREDSENIGNVIQNELTRRYSSDGSSDPYDFLLSSNMISVGVDVGRLGTMIVVGQPKTTSEYIQATSRVGRETPGIVLTTYNQSKSRDRSHYENFTQYHDSFYRFVEATSLTPFSDRARDRALQALYVILCRNLIPVLSGDGDAVNYDRGMPELEPIRKYILDYVRDVDPEEYEHVKADIEDIEYAWNAKSSRRDSLRYRFTDYCDQDKVLFDPDYCENSRFRVLNSMRSVETTVKVFINEDRSK